MKNAKVSGVRLAVAGIALVVVAVAGTLGWFAHNSNARIESFSMNVSSPSGVAEMNGIWYYDPEEQLDTAQWKEYTDSQVLSIIPGQEIKFRVRFTASGNQKVTMKLKDIRFGFDDSTEGNTVVIEKDGVSMGLPKLFNVLQYAKSPGPAGFETAQYRYLSEDLSFYLNGSSHIPEVLIESGSNASDYSQPSGVADPGKHEYYYSLYYPPTENDNDYMDSKIAFKLDLTFS